MERKVPGAVQVKETVLNNATEYLYTMGNDDYLCGLVGLGCYTGMISTK